MKLRNKKTHEIKEISDEERDLFDLVKKLGSLEDWEIIEEKEPLIKDEKIRKAVRAWAEACTYDGACIVEYDKRANELSGLAHTTIIALGEIDFDLEDRKRYTIAELCGEED